MQSISKSPLWWLCSVVVLAFQLAGCTAGGPEGGTFQNCGNGVINGDEQCDDGNTSDNDDCLSTCVIARCGDTFIDSQGTVKEECDTFNLGAANCVTLGFNPGLLSCNPDCTYNTSGCPAKPTPSPTATGSPSPTATPTRPVLETPTATPKGPTPTFTATPILSCESVTVTVRLVYDTDVVPELAGLVVDLNYPEHAVSIPGSDSDASVAARVTDLSGAHGLSSLDDHDTNSDGLDDQLTNVYATGENIPPGNFEQVVFDCTDMAPVPEPGSFTCAVSDAVDPQAFPVTGVSCAVDVSPVLRPTPTAPPHTPTPSATATSRPPTPTPIPTCATLNLTVALTYDPNAVPELAGLVLDLHYGPAVSIPGSDSDDSVLARVTDVSGAHGFGVISDVDTGSDGVDDQVHNVYATGGNIAPSDFEQVQFDCIPGMPIPTASDFTCAVSEAVDPQAFPVEGVGCTIRLTAE